MKEKIEFDYRTYVEENPNPKNDIYQPYAGKGYDVLTIIKAVLSILGMILFADSGSPAEHDFLGNFLAELGCLFFVWQSVRYFYKKYPYRKKVIQKGTPYPGVVTDQFDYETGHIKYVGKPKNPVAWSRICIRYYDNKIADTGHRKSLGLMYIDKLERSPSEYLENPYCTVYVWKRKRVAADFKVRDEYISDDGTFDPDPPSKD